VVIRKRQNQIEVWDSAKGYQVKTYKEFAKVFGNVMMIVTKKKTNLPPILNKKTKILKSINVKYLLLSVLLNVLAISLSIAGAKYLTMVIDNSITSESFSNFISISILFGFLYIMEGLTNYVLHIYSTMFVKTNFCYLSHRFLQKIRYKNKIFYSKVDKNQIMLMDNAMTAIAQHYAVDITAFVTNIFLCFACIIIICSLNL
jgi:ABC-type bacteriocin/lantibiotic exporter with double-glycine peptidase domain